MHCRALLHSCYNYRNGVIVNSYISDIAEIFLTLERPHSALRFCLE